MNDLDHQVGMDEHALAGVVGDILSKSMEPWFIRRLNEEEIISAIEQLNVVLVRKRAQKRASLAGRAEQSVEPGEGTAPPPLGPELRAS